MLKLFVIDVPMLNKVYYVLKRVFLETVKLINAKFCGNVVIHRISRFVSSVFQVWNLNFNDFFFFFISVLYDKLSVMTRVSMFYRHDDCSSCRRTL